jgi:YidC/Oxa1 family membrane protein insertase
MSTFLGVPVDAAYHVVSSFAHLLAPLLGGLAAAAAIVLFTMAVRLLVLPLSYRATRGMEAQARVAPQVQALQRKHAGQPDRLQRELKALYHAEGTSMFAGCLPMLLQWPFLSVLYLLFRSPKIGGAVNTLLSHDLFGAPLGSHWLAGPGPLSPQGAVFAGLFLLLAGLGWLSARATRRLATAPKNPAPKNPAPKNPAPKNPAANQPATAQPAGAAALLTRLMPYATVVIAAFVPLAAGLYLITSSAWTLAERTLLRRSGRAEMGLPRSTRRGYRQG